MWSTTGIVQLNSEIEMMAFPECTLYNINVGTSYNINVGTLYNINVGTLYNINVGTLYNINVCPIKY